MRTITPRHAKRRPPAARAAWCMAGMAGFCLALAACAEPGAGSVDGRQHLSERRALDGAYYTGADANFQRGAKGGGP